MSAESLKVLRGRPRLASVSKEYFWAGSDEGAQPEWIRIAKGPGEHRRSPALEAPLSLAHGETSVFLFVVHGGGRRNLFRERAGLLGITDAEGS